MTDVAAEVPAQTNEPAAGTAQTAEAGQPAEAQSTTGAPAEQAAEPGTIRERASAVASDIADRASDAIDKAGEAASGAVDATREAAQRAAVRIRNNATLPASRGHTTIANEVVEKIAGIAAREVPGVYDLGGDVARMFSAVKERLHLGEESADQGVSVKLEGKEAEIEVVIVIEFGFQVYSVTEKVREKVISSVENLLGLDITAVNVIVDDVHIDDDAAPGNDAERAVGYSPETKAIVVGAPAES
ncbi:Asp23/Gls24 family envelope stress response protein [Rugosimonospora africana]|uniref:Asp23/Gls24 family envelope stress response protein n=1 Tax=Rugosimonospora africana TaxID=556532 RepID=A0A8J3QN19_9ACTN|nr:Asp23/Gls24 family envelope stress response protein [Rugosimonospora africana]GIH13501.1 hypothetical protein Raf01_16730 [Rugosimonospora africana]